MALTHRAVLQLFILRAIVLGAHSCAAARVLTDVTDVIKLTSSVLPAPSNQTFQAGPCSWDLGPWLRVAGPDGVPAMVGAPGAQCFGAFPNITYVNGDRNGGIVDTSLEVTTIGGWACAYSDCDNDPQPISAVMLSLGNGSTVTLGTPRRGHHLYQGAHVGHDWNVTSLKVGLDSSSGHIVYLHIEGNNRGPWTTAYTTYTFRMPTFYTFDVPSNSPLANMTVRAQYAVATSHLVGVLSAADVNGTLGGLAFVFEASPPAPGQSSSSGKLSTGAIAGIVVGCVVGAALLVALVFWAVRHCCASPEAAKGASDPFAKPGTAAKAEPVAEAVQAPHVAVQVPPPRVAWA